MTLPNFITILRLFAVPLVMMLIIQRRWDYALMLFVFAGISDALDGFIARQFNMKSELGAYLDALADKALLVCIYVTLAVVNVVPIWLAILVVSRDVMIVSAVLLSWVLNNPVHIKPLLISKINTGVQIAFAALVLASRAFDIPLGMGENMGEGLVAALTLASMAAYLTFWLRHMATNPDPKL
jgi:cardiolipin synthase (CMP-forming)